MEMLIIFAVLSILNVITSTVRSLLTVKGGKWAAALSSAGYFAFYNIVLVATVADFPMWQKCAITFACNLIGVFLVKFVEEKMQKDRLWVFNVTLKERKNGDNIDKLTSMCERAGIKYVYNEVVPNQLFTIQIFSYTQKNSDMIKSILTNFDLKYYIVESK